MLEVMAGLPALHVQGLMPIPPFAEDPERTRPYFRRLRELRDEMVAGGLLQGTELSMGMSHDFEVAVEEGATLVRVGTALFGERADLASGATSVALRVRSSRPRANSRGASADSRLSGERSGATGSAPRLDRRASDPRR